MNARWHIDRLLAPCAGQDGFLPIVDAEDGPTGRVVCIIPGHLEWQTTPETVVRLLDEEDAENARLITAAPELRAMLAGLVEWAARTGGWSAPCWQDAQDLLAGLRTPHASV